MRLAIVNLTGGGLSGGYRKYLRSVVPLLRQDPRVERLDVYVPPTVAANDQLGLGEFHTWEQGDVLRGFRGLRAEIRRLAPDVVFIPTARWLNCGPIPIVVMVRNMEALASPFGENPLPVAVRNLARSYAARRACRRAQGVIAVSQYVSEFLVEKVGVSPAKVRIVSHGVTQGRDSGRARQPEACERFRGGDFLFTAGSVRPYRGLGDIVDALVAVGEANAVPVVVAGSPDHDSVGYAAALKRRAKKRGVGRRLIWAGQLSAEELAWCFAHCAAFLMTSRVEACPNTLLEAMSYGCICVSTSSPPMPEFLGESALYYPAGDGTALARQLALLPSLGAGERERLRRGSLVRAAEFTWERTVEGTLSILEQVVRRDGSPRST